MRLQSPRAFQVKVIRTKFCRTCHETKIYVRTTRHTRGRDTFLPRPRTRYATRAGDTPTRGFQSHRTNSFKSTRRRDFCSARHSIRVTVPCIARALGIVLVAARLRRAAHTPRRAVRASAHRRNEQIRLGWTSISIDLRRAGHMFVT